MVAYVWRRGARFWFQMAIPGGAREALGSTPIRIPLPCDLQAEAARYACRLAGLTGAEFMPLNKERFSGVAGISAGKGTLHNPRDQLYNKLVAEIRSITSQVSGHSP
jgi:hypothetical protein